MKIKVTEIEANAEDLRAGQTLGTAFCNALRNAFSNVGVYDESSGCDDEDESEGE